LSVFAQQQIRHLKGWGLGKKSGDDFIERTKNNLPSLWDGELAESFCANFDGVASYGTLTAPIVFSYDKDWAYSYYWKYTGDETERVLFGSTTATSGYIGRTNTIDNDFILYEGIGTAVGLIEFSSVFIDLATYKIESSYSKTTKIWTVTRTNIDTGIDTETETVTLVPLGNWSFSVNLIGKRGADDRYLKGDIYDLKVSIDAVEKLDTPSQGSLLDISGNSNNITNSGIDLYETQRFFHYNIMYGFDDYTDDATGLIHVYVPYVDGSPVVASITDYTKQTSNPAGIFHNGAETKVVPFTSSHDGTGWVVPASIKSIDTDYLLHNEVTGYAIPLSYAALATLDAANSAYVFVDTDTARQRKNLMLYTEELTGVELTKARAFVNH